MVRVRVQALSLLPAGTVTPRHRPIGVWRDDAAYTERFIQTPCRVRAQGRYL